MSYGITDLPQAYLLRLADRVLKGNTEYAGEDWEFEAGFTQSLTDERNTYLGLVEDQDLSQKKKEKIVQTKDQHFEKVFVPLLRKVIHYIRATADDPENVLQSYGFDPGDFPRREPDVIMLGQKMQHGDDDSQGEPWALTVKVRQELDDALLTAQTLVADIQVESGKAQEITQNQDESRVRLEKLLIKAREWLYAMVPQGRHDEILEVYGFKPIREASRKKKEPFPAPGMLMYDMFRNEFSWQFVAGATGYELEILNKSTQETITIETAANQKRLDLAKGDYETKVRALRQAQGAGNPASDPVYSDWSGDVPFTVKPAPGQFKFNPGLKKLSWSPVAGATMYEVRKDGSFAPVYLGPDTEFVLDLPAGQYKFRVRGGDEMANWWSAWSETLIVDV